MDQPWTYVAILSFSNLDPCSYTVNEELYVHTDVSTALKYGTHTAIQLSAEEVLQLADLLGFEVDHTSRDSIDSLYAEQPETLLKFTYGAPSFLLALGKGANMTCSYAVLVGNKENRNLALYSGRFWWWTRLNEVILSVLQAAS